MTDTSVNILGVEFINKTKQEFVFEILSRIEKQEKTFAVTANPEIVMYARKHSSYMKILEHAHMVIPDGIGVVKGAQILGKPLKERVPGYELLLELLAEADKKALKVYFLGAKESVVTKAVSNVAAQYPNIDIVGYRDGYFDLKDEKVLEEVKQKNPDMVFAALGFPKQELWISQYLEIADKGFLMGVGGSFDVLSGTSQRAPEFYLKHNLEWFYRLIKQPTRFKRMLALPKFVIAVCLQKIKH